MSHPHDLVRVTELIDGQFRLVRPLGRGGMGSVWVAEDQHLGRAVAIKFLARDLSHDPQARLRFEREPRLASMIRSPHVVQIYGQGTTDEGLPYLVMELLDGEDLASRLAREGRCDLEDAARIVTQVASALTRAHHAGLIHRDIKPHNIFLTNDDDRDFVKVLDFGVAKKLNTHAAALTQTGAVLGSLPYMSPEQLDSSPAVGPATDVWALGVVAYEMLTGEQPFSSVSLPELFTHILDGNYVPISALGIELPHALDQFFAKALAVDPKQRFASVVELDRALVALVRANTSGLSLKSSTPLEPRARAVLPTIEAPPSSSAPDLQHRIQQRSRPWRWLWIALLASGAMALTSYALHSTAPRRPRVSAATVRPAPLPSDSQPAAPVKPAPLPSGSPPAAPLKPSTSEPATPVKAAPAASSSSALLPSAQSAPLAAGLAQDAAVRQPAASVAAAAPPVAPQPSAAAAHAPLITQAKPAAPPPRKSLKTARPNYGF